MGKARDHFKKTGDTKGTLQAKMGTIKDRSSRGQEKVARIYKETVLKRS